MERLSKWEPTGRSGVYLGHYYFHSGSVELVLNIRTGYVPPQYHVVFDNNLSDVDHMRKDTLPVNWEKLAEEHSELATQGKITLEK